MKTAFFFLLLFSSSIYAFPLRIAHRGAPAHAPENSLKAMRKALELGCDYLETDIQGSKDNILVIMHDSTVDRTTKGEGKVAFKSLAELKQLDLGEGEKIPTLAEVLNLSLDYPEAKFILELKTGLEVPVVEMVKKLKLEEKVILKSFSLPMLKKLRELAPKIPQIYVYVTSFWGITIDTWLRFQNPLEQNVEYLQSHQWFTSMDFIQEAHKSGKKVIVWGVETKEDMKKWKEALVDGIETDHLENLNSL